MRFSTFAYCLQYVFPSSGDVYTSIYCSCMYIIFIYNIHMWPAGTQGNVEIVIFLVHDWIFVKYPGPRPGISILSIFVIFDIFDIFGFRCARPPAGPRVLCPNPLISHKILENDGIHHSKSDYSANVLHSHMEFTHVARRKSGKCRNCDFLGT